MASQNFRTTRSASDPTASSFIKNLVQYGLLLKSIDIIGSLWSDQQILWVFIQDVIVVRRLGQLLVMLVLASILNLLQEVMLLLVHYGIPCTATCVFLALFKLIFERLNIDSNTSIIYDLLSSICCNCSTIADATYHALYS